MMRGDNLATKIPSRGYPDASRVLGDKHQIIVKFVSAGPGQGVQVQHLVRDPIYDLLVGEDGKVLVLLQCVRGRGGSGDEASGVE